MYVCEKKQGDEYIMQVAKCTHCFSDNIVKIDDHFVCAHCGKEYKLEEMK